MNKYLIAESSDVSDVGSGSGRGSWAANCASCSLLAACGGHHGARSSSVFNKSLTMNEVADEWPARIFEYASHHGDITCGLCNMPGRPVLHAVSSASAASRRCCSNAAERRSGDVAANADIVCNCKTSKMAANAASGRRSSTKTIAMNAPAVSNGLALIIMFRPRPGDK